MNIHMPSRVNGYPSCRPPVRREARRSDENLCHRSEEEGIKGAAYKLHVHSAKDGLAMQ